MTLVAAHQPNFLPWLGYFDKIRRADVFVVLDDVQFEKSGAGTWTNRVQIRVAGDPAWITVPVVRAYHGTRAISEMQIDSGSQWREKLLRTIELNYRRAPYFDAVYPWLASLVRLESDSLLEYNMNAIQATLTRIGLANTRLVASSSLDVRSRATERIIELVQVAGGDSYLAGGGAQGYQVDDRFAEAGLRLVYQDFRHPTYPQQGASQFIPGLSIIDALLNVGFEGTAELLRTGAAS